MTDEQKHAEARRRGYPHAIFIPPSLYRMAESAGHDMTMYVPTRPIPLVEENK